MLRMGVRDRASGRTAEAMPPRRRAAGGKSTDSDDLRATAKPAAQRRDGRPRKRPRRADGTGGSASDTTQRHRGSAIPPRPGQAAATTAKPAARQRSRDNGSRASAHRQSTAPMRRPESLSSECRGSSDDLPGRASRPEQADIDELKTQLYRLLDAVLARASTLAKRFQGWMDTLFEAVENGSAGMRAGLEAVRAVLTGKNPVWAAIKGLWSGLSGPAKAALVLLVVLGLVLAPVLLVILLLALLVVALIAAVRAAAE